MDVELSERVKLWGDDYMRMLLDKYDPKYKFKEPDSINNNSEKLPIQIMTLKDLLKIILNLLIKQKIIY